MEIASNDNSNEFGNDSKVDLLSFKSDFKQIKKESMDSRTTLDSFSTNDCSTLAFRSRTTEQLPIPSPRKMSYQEQTTQHLNNMRHSYFQKLISHGVMPTKQRKTHNALIIFDWDDTLLCTSFLTPNGYFDEQLELTSKSKERMAKLEQTVLQILTLSIEKADTFIITNAEGGWVEYSAARFYPSVSHLLNKIKIISARDLYEAQYPGDDAKWKSEAFNKIVYQYDQKLITNIICVGDSFNEIQAGKTLASKFENVCIKTIKFKQNPKIDDLKMQLTLIIEKFSYIFSAVKNWNITIEKKNKKKNSI